MSFPNAPELTKLEVSGINKIVACVNRIMQGKTNNTGEVTLAASSTTTVVTLAKGRLGQDTLILFEPTTANAATAFGSMYVSARNVADGQFTITHQNNSQNDRTFKFALIG